MAAKLYSKQGQQVSSMGFQTGKMHSSPKVKNTETSLDPRMTFYNTTNKESVLNDFNATKMAM